MSPKELPNNYIFTLIKFILFFIIFCFFIELSKAFWEEMRVKEHFDSRLLTLSVLAPFIFYVLFADLNEVYQKIQNFFFRSSFFSLVFPSLLLFAASAYLLLPKVFDVSFGTNTFVFLGGAAATMHLIFVAGQTKGETFSGFINYLFIFTILLVLNLIIFCLYLRIGFNVNIGKIALEGIKGGAALIQNIFTQTLG